MPAHSLYLNYSFLEQQLEKIHLGIKNLQKLHQDAILEVDQLRKENELLQRKLVEYEEQSISTSKQHLVNRITENAVDSEVEKKQMKLKINELVREVDKCIALLNQ